MDPGAKDTQEHSLNVILDVVKRYDIDGVHMDDYFYPYKEKDAAGNNIQFPDEASYRAYQRSGGKLGRDDWRRWSVDTFIERLYAAIKKENRTVRFGLSPFGIWRPGNPPGVTGMDQYNELYADARKWLREGWVDYYTPQLYWSIASTGQSYPRLLAWWAEQNVKSRNLWPGNYTGRVQDGTSNWSADEIVNQIEVTRRQPGATGNVHFSMAAFSKDRGGLVGALSSGPYARPALVPASPWLDNDRPDRPKATVRKEPNGRDVRAEWQTGGKDKPWLAVVQAKVGTQWFYAIVPAGQKAYVVKPGAGTVEAVAVSLVDRCGNQGPAAVLRP
jgi:uncharacterized lipoprotein YddW (UPF0748 family)